MKNSALVVIDLQNDITKNYREVIENVNEAIDWAVRKDLWVVRWNEDLQTRNPRRRAGAGAERRVRPYLYEDKKQRPDQ